MMTLTVPSLQDLKKITVKIICPGESNIGSGTLVFCNGVLYVLTAAHVILDKGKALYDLNTIIVSASKDDTDYPFRVLEVPHFSVEKDCAVLRVENVGGFPEEPLKQVRITKQVPAGNGMLCGFGGDGNSLKTYNFRQVSDTIWALVGFDVTQQSLPAKDNWGGFSGSGIFFKGGEVLAFSSYVKGLKEIEGNNNEFECFPADRFAEYPPLREIIIDIPVEVASNDSQRDTKKVEVYFQALNDSILPENHDGQFIDDDNLQRIIRKLKSDDQRTIMLTALSGLGKSRLLYESFKETLQKPQRYYCKFSDGKQALLGELKYLLKSGAGSEGVIIIDDCPVDLLKDVVVCRNMFNKDFRIIATNNDFFNIYDDKSYEVIRLQPSEIRNSVNQYIEDALRPDDRTRSSVEEIKRLSDGFPQMAIALVEEFKKEEKVNVDVVKDLMPKLLKFDPTRILSQQAVMQTLSLCLPLPYSGGQSEAFKFLLSEDLFTPLDGMDWPKRRSLAAELISKYKPTLIDVQSDWLYVRPFPLAVWLTSEWFAHVCNSNEHFKELIEKILQQPDYVQNAISEGFCKHIEQMHGNKSAFALVEKLVVTGSLPPFFDEEVLTSGLGSKFFLAMSTVNPHATAKCLADVFLPKEIDWLRKHLIGNARRNIVWALERLCFAKESYSMASKVMARLAVAENESISNNATGQVKQLFHIFLAGTEVSLDERVKTLEYLFSMGAEYAHLAIACCNNAFKSRDFIRTGGAEKYGFISLKDYQPSSYREINDYWNKCLEVLLKVIEGNQDYVCMVAGLVEDNTMQWVRDNRWDTLEPLLEYVTTYKGHEWDKEYDALSRVKRIQKEEMLPAESLDKLEQWVDRIKPKTFITDLKDARQLLWSNYRLKDSEIAEYSLRLFEPLAERFIKDAVFKDKNEVDLILSDNDYIDNVFSKRLVQLMKEDDLKDFFGLLLDLLMQKEEDFSSPFLLNFCRDAVGSSSFDVFVESMRQNGRMSQYYYLMAFTEQEDLRHFKHLCSLYSKDELPIDFLSSFLQGVRALDRNGYLKLAKEVHRVFPDRSNDLIRYILSHRFSFSKEEYCNDIIKQAALDYEIREFDANFEYFRLLVDILEQSNDTLFAKSLNRKMIEAYNMQLGFHGSEGVFPILLKNYLDEIWGDFEKAFVSPDYFLFYYQVKDELGAGYGFGEGPLFKVDETRLHRMCFNYPEVAPYRLASMVPFFDESDESFSEWVVWLLDNFGDRKEVLDSLHSNLGTFSWTGSTVFYYKRNISSFEKLRDHKRAEVRDWAEKCLKDEKAMLASEISNETFMNIRYGRKDSLE